MLKIMGLTCVTGKGEAEALCAYLNAKELVSGVISQDSDCFAYGARVVYRNYSKVDNKIDVYDLSRAENLLSFSRNKIIVIALFCGSDYNCGVNGVGREAILNFLSHFKDDEILDRIRYWRANDEYYEVWDLKLKDKNDRSIDEGFRTRMKNELIIRKKAIKDPFFPNEDLINEYLDFKDDIEELDLTWRQPNLIAMMNFATKLLSWKEFYTFIKVLPLLTYWQLKNYKLVQEKIASNNLSDLKGVLFVKYIKDRKTLKGIRSFEVVWEDKHKYFDGLIPQEQISCTNDQLWTTIEKAELVEEAYPVFVEDFEEQIRRKKIEKRNNRQNRPNNKSKKTRKIVDEVPTSIAQKIDCFFPKTKVSKLKAESKHNVSFDLNCSGFSDDDDANISLVVDRIVSKPPKILENIKRMDIKCLKKSDKKPQLNDIDCCSTDVDYNNLIIESNLEFMREQHNFNVSNPFHATNCNETISGDETLNYDADELEILNEIDRFEESGNEIDKNNRDEVFDEDDNKDELNDTFDLDKPYIPLFERIKKQY